MANNRATELSLLKTLVGAGMLALPYALRCQGLLLGVLSIAFCQAASLAGAAMLAYCSGFLPAHQTSFFALARISYPKLAPWFDVAIGLKCFGVCVSYLVIIGSLMPEITAYFGVETNSVAWLLAAVVISAPFCYRHSLESLRTACLVALGGVAYLLALAVAHLLRNDTADQRGEISFAPAGLGPIISSVPIVVFAFTMSQNVPAALNEIEDRRLTNVFRVLLRATSAAALIYYVIGLVGYLSFGSNVSDNLVNMYRPSPASMAARFAIVVLVLFSYPLMCHPARASIENIVLYLRPAVPAAQISGEQPPAEPSSPLLPTPAGQIDLRLSRLATTGILVLSFILAVSLNSLELILSFVGASGATAVSFIFPGLFAYKLAARDNPLLVLSSRQARLVRLTGLALAVFGVVVAVLAIGVNIWRIVSSK